MKQRPYFDAVTTANHDRDRKTDRWLFTAIYSAVSTGEPIEAEAADELKHRLEDLLAGNDPIQSVFKLGRQAVRKNDRLLRHYRELIATYVWLRCMIGDSPKVARGSAAEITGETDEVIRHAERSVPKAIAEHTARLWMATACDARVPPEFAHIAAKLPAFPVDDTPMRALEDALVSAKALAAREAGEK